MLLLLACAPEPVDIEVVFDRDGTGLTLAVLTTGGDVLTEAPIEGDRMTLTVAPTERPKMNTVAFGRAASWYLGARDEDGLWRGVSPDQLLWCPRCSSEPEDEWVWARGWNRVTPQHQGFEVARDSLVFDLPLDLLVDPLVLSPPAFDGLPRAVLTVAFLGTDASGGWSEGDEIAATVELEWCPVSDAG